MAPHGEIVVTLDGEVVSAEHPVAFVDDPVFLRGDGVFETALVRDGWPCLLEAHLERLGRSAAIVGLPAPDLVRWRAACLAATARCTSADEAVLRMVLGRDREGAATGFVAVSDLPPRVAVARRDGLSAMTLERGTAQASAPWSVARAKSLSYAVNTAALRHADRRGVDDVIFTSADGDVLEGPRSSVVIAGVDGSLATPPTTMEILPGTTVTALFDVARSRGVSCEERPIHVDDLVAAQSVWLLSSVTLAARVHTLDGHRLPPPVESVAMAALVDEAIAPGR